LTANKVRIVCDEKILEIESLEGKKITVRGDKPSKPIDLISIIKAGKCLRKGSEVYLAYVMTPKEEKKSDDVLVVTDYLDVFPKELPRLRPDRQVEFRIDLMPRTTPIAKAPIG
jgi:hypothetical protein